MSQLLFDGLKVLDVGSWIAAPVAATMLADMGAKVIKVEVPGAGDGYRNFSASPGAADSDENYAWQMDARNKRSMCLNLKSEQGREILLRMVRDADVYITNHTPAMRARFATGYDDLRQINPKLIYASLTAYGEAGPENNREAFDLVAYWSRSGLMDLVRAPGAHPGPALPGMGDHPTAVAMYGGIVTALLRRERFGEGSYVHTSLLANGIWSASCIAQAAYADGDFERYRRDHGNLYTRVLYEAADGRWIQFSMVRTEQDTEAMLAVLGVPHLLLDEKFATPEARLANGAELTLELREAIAKASSEVWMTQFHQAGVPAALVGRVEDLPNDPQVQANQFFVDPGNTGLDRLLKHPVNVEGLERATPDRAPEMGEHTHEILAELGFTSDQISDFQKGGVV
ncbi:MAG: CaiB/BaiF CoA-transferase family protein [Pseudomonadota bacterium]